MIRKSFSILFLWLCAMVGVAQTDGYDPVNPPNPDAPATTYLLVTAVQPAQAGSSNVSGSSYTAGSSVYVYTYNNNGYVFKHWTDGTNIVSTNSSFYYTMPANNARLTAVYEYDPTAPDNPSGDYTLSHYLNLKASPSQGGSFNYNSNDKFKSGQQLSLYAYSNSNYTFKHWEYKGEVVSTNYYLNFTMPDVNAELVAVYDYTPATPQDPGTNFWNAETGELIVDAFTAGNLSNAIYNVTGGNTSNVQSLIVNGKVSDYDIGNMEGYPFSVVDFSRCAGATNVPSYSFDDNTTLTSISLPASITNIGYRSFSNCSALTSVSCYATVPPTLESYVFEGIKDQLVIFVPATSIDLYQEAAGWKDLTILPLSSQVNALEVNLPAGSDDGRFKNMFIELVNSNSGQRMRYVISDRTAYTFQNLMHNTKWNVYVKNATGQILGQIEDIEMQTSDRSVTFQSLVEPQTIKAIVKTPEGIDVTSQLAITWMNTDGSFLGKEASVSGLLPIDNTSVVLRATLPQALAMQYQLLADTTYVVQTSANTITQTLKALPTAKLTGTVRDVLTNAVLGGATVTVSQTLNGKYSKAFTTTANAQGVYSLDAFYAPTSITAVATDYISQTVLYDSLTIENGVATLEDIALKSINGATITLNFTYTAAAASGSAAETQSYYSDYQNVAYDIRDITTGQDIKQFNVQYPQIVLLEDVALGDSLQLTATSKTGSFMPVVAKGQVNDMNRAEVTFDIKQLGQISATFVSTENSAVNGILYDSKGKFVKNSAYSNAALSFTNLTDGDYTLVTMGNSKLFNTIYDLSKFEQAGLKDGTDYVATQVKVQSGVITTVKTSYVPFFDESKMYYTGDNTSFTVNKTQITAGNYLTVNSRIDFKSVYASEVSNVRLIVDLPEACSLVDNSVMVGSALGAYISAAGRITVPVENIGDRIRFCVIPTAGGDYAPSAYVQFTYNDQEVTQPIGSANFSVKDLSITVPSTIAKTSVPIIGMAVAKGEVDVFDNGVNVGHTVAMANGTWSITIELDDPYNLSTHEIYAKVKAPNGLEYQSETAELTYDQSAIEVLKVTMINTAHPSTSLNLCEYVTTFDFKNPSKPQKAYWYWPSYPDFTFLVDFTSNDTTLISNVQLHVLLSDNSVSTLTPKYDKKKDCWIATSQYHSSALPTNVNVTFDAISDVVCDRNLLEDEQSSLITSFIEAGQERATLEQDLAEEVEIPNKELYAQAIALLEQDEDSEENENASAISTLLETLLQDTETFEASNVEVDEDEDIDAWLKQFEDDELLQDSLLSAIMDDVLPPSISTDDLSSDYTYTIPTEDGYKTITRKTLTSIDAEQLLADGFEEVKMTDESIVYVKNTSDSQIYVDVKKMVQFEVKTSSEEEISSSQYASRRNIGANDRTLVKCISSYESLVHSISDLASAIKAENDSKKIRSLISSSISTLNSIKGSIECMYENTIKDIFDKFDAESNELLGSYETTDRTLKQKRYDLRTRIGLDEADKNRLLNNINSNKQEIARLEKQLSETTEEGARAVIQSNLDLERTALKSNQNSVNKLNKSIKKNLKGIEKIDEKIAKNVKKFEKAKAFVGKTKSFLNKIPKGLSNPKALKAFKVAGNVGKVIGTSVGAALQLIPLWLDAYDFGEELVKWDALWADILAKWPCKDNQAEYLAFVAKSLGLTTVHVGAQMSTVGASTAALVLDLTNVPHAWLASLVLDIYSWSVG